MDDQQLWDIGALRLKGLLAEFPAGVRSAFDSLLTRYRQSKETLAETVAAVDSASICGECAGQCCLNGKYRMNVFDTLAHIASKFPTSADFTRKPVCPYGTAAGCTMEPGLRPADCVLFICEAIEQKLSPQARSVIEMQEGLLRECILDTSRLTGESLGTPLLLWAEKNCKSN